MALPRDTKRPAAEVADVPPCEKKAKARDYATEQQKLPKVAPIGGMTFEDLRQDPQVVFRDVTPALVPLGALVADQKRRLPVRAARSLLRGRRWGKSVLGDMWLEFLRGRADLFRGTWAEKRMRPDRFIGITLDLSACSSYGAFIDLLIRQINKGLEVAENVEGYGEAAKGQQVAIPPGREPVGPSGSWSAMDCTAMFQSLLGQLEDICRQAGRSVALLVDEYDSMVNKATRPGAQLDYQEVSSFFADFYTTLKAQSRAGTIPFQLILGSSRIAIKGFWSGANNVIDVSLDPAASTILGYTWEEITTLYPRQLELLKEHLNMNDAELKAEMEKWYNNHRWSPKSDAVVFNPYCVQEFMRQGSFEAYWADTGESSLLLASGLFAASAVRLATRKTVQVSYGSLTTPSVPDPRGSNASDVEAQLALLAGAGLLAIPKEYRTEGPWLPTDDVDLTVPNEDARAMMIKVLRHAWPSPPLSAAAVEQHVTEGNVAQLLALPALREALRQGLSFFSGSASPQSSLLDLDEPNLEARVSEYRTSLSLAATLLQVRLLKVGYRIEELCSAICTADLDEQAADVQAGREPRKLQQKDGRSFLCDHLFDVPGHPPVVHVLEFKVLRDRRLRQLLADALWQCLRYQLVNVRERVDAADVRFSAHVFGDEGEEAGTLLAGTPSLQLAAAHRLVARLKDRRDTLEGANLLGTRVAEL